MSITIKDVNFVPVFRIVTFVPKDYVSMILDAVTKVDSLKYGEYRSVSWSSVGIERYIPETGSNPTFGVQDKLSEEESVRLEFSILAESGESHRKAVILAIAKVHPWEEPVILITQATETRTVKS